MNNGRLVISVAMGLLTFIGFVIFSLNRRMENELSRLMTQVDQLENRHAGRILKIEDWKAEHDRIIERRDAHQWERIVALERQAGFAARDTGD